MSVRSSSRVESGPAQLAKRLTGPWWAYLLAGIAWVIISVIILRYNIASVVVRAYVSALGGSVDVVAHIGARSWKVA
jgi:uncharacterized membrane protein HdeD (DUF308 family)